MNETNEAIEQFMKGKELDCLWLKKLSFANILICSNLMQTMFTKTQEDMTSKQWLLLTISSSFDESPTLSEVGTLMGCSRQNVKQIADVLNKKGYLIYTKVPGDKNTVRLVPTQKWFTYCKKFEKKTLDILNNIFKEFSQEDLQKYFQSFLKIIKNIENINNNL